jgi:predicted nucleotidyltransferase
MSNRKALMARLEAQARSADELHAQSRALLTQAARAGAMAGLTQRQIAEAIGRSQPEVSRLLRFHSATERGRALVSRRRGVLDIVRKFGGRNVRVFGSVATGKDTEASDIDLLVAFDRVPSLFAIAKLERELGALLKHRVDVTPVSAVPKHMLDRAETESMPL